MKLSRKLKFVLILVVATLALGCSKIRAPNEPWRGTDVSSPEDLSKPVEVVDCEKGELDENDNTKCSTAVIEQYDNYDLAFVEFTERGNLFNRNAMDEVLNHIEKISETTNGAQVIVFVHGWKHNASDNDTNVHSFRDTLEVVGATTDKKEGRRTVGVYVGWRGMSWDIPGIKELSFWERKAVAEEVGQGGVSELLVKLHHLTGKSGQGDNANKNIFLVVGHSFGGAIVLSSLHDIMLDRLIDAHYDDVAEAGECGIADSFADGLVLLNPAIEANQIIQLKENSSDCQFPSDQMKLMHVISTDADKATSFAFPLGQWLDTVLTWNQEKLYRTSENSSGYVKLREYDLDITTIGNHEQFRSGYLNKNGPDWEFNFCPGVGDAHNDCNVKDLDNHFPVKKHDPLVFIKTGEAFMEGHNDVFNCNVRGYLISIIYDSLFQRTGDLDELPELAQEECFKDGEFNYQRCYAFHRLHLKSPVEKSGSEDSNKSCSS